jgi:hemoglobin-like flavoprotein
MVAELKYATIAHVIESWEKIRRMKNYEEVAGAKLFQKLFLRDPTMKLLFGFPIDIDVKCEEVLQSRRFLRHATYLVGTLDTALNMLGPDIELLTEIMLDLGVKHVTYGVKHEYFPIMGKVL